MHDANSGKGAKGEKSVKGAKVRRVRKGLEISKFRSQKRLSVELGCARLRLRLRRGLRFVTRYRWRGLRLRT